MQVFINILIGFFVLLFSTATWSQTAVSQWAVVSPDKTLKVTVRHQAKQGLTYKVEKQKQDDWLEVLGWSDLGLVLSWVDQQSPRDTQIADFTESVDFIGQESQSVSDEYQMLTGKRRNNVYRAEQTSLTFADKETAKTLRVDFQVANDGVAFRYALTDTSPLSHWISEETTSFNLGLGGKHWGQAYDIAMAWTPSYETPYQNGIDIGTAATPEQGTGWGFPSLFEDNNGLWVLLHESNLTRSYHGSHLEPEAPQGHYKITFPLKDSAHGFGKNFASTLLPAQLPWRFMLISENVADIVESNRVFDLAAPSTLSNTDWIKPGIASWSWWSDHASSRDHEKMLPFIDLAADMGWPYSLIDANWNLISDTSMEDLLDYANSKGVDLGFWYNSGGRSNFVTEEPRNIMDNPRRRQQEFAKLKKLGVKYIKVDFFHSDKQDMIARYLDILEDAAEYQIMVVFHGCTIPRGWERTYPHLMSMEAVRAELALYQNTILPFTRNVIGSLDYTPVDFLPQMTPNITTHAHEAALGVVMESALQHLSDSVESYRSLSPDYAEYLKALPAVWDETKYLGGYPGKDTIMARRSGKVWYLVGINGEKVAKEFSLDVSFLKQSVQATLLHDDQGPKEFASREITLDPGSPLKVTMAANGGFVIFTSVE